MLALNKLTSKLIMYFIVLLLLLLNIYINLLFIIFLATIAFYESIPKSIHRSISLLPHCRGLFPHIFVETMPWADIARLCLVPAKSTAPEESWEHNRLDSDVATTNRCINKPLNRNPLSNVQVSISSLEIANPARKLNDH